MPIADCRRSLVNDLSFLRSVDLREVDTFVVEKDLHVVEQELVRIGIRHVETEMINELLLFRLPLRPAILADLGTDLLTEFGRYRSNAQWFVFLPATGAFELVTK